MRDCCSFMRSATSSRSSFESFRYRIEPLWAAALGIHVVVFGRAIVPGLIHLVGRGGQTETVEWAIYLSLFFVYAPLVAVIAWLMPRRVSPDTASWVRFAIVLAAIVELVRYMLNSDWLFILSATMAAIVTVVALGYTGQSNGRSRSGGLPKMIPLLLVSAFGWMCAGTLVSWGDALQWIASSPRTAVIVVVVIGLTAFALRADRVGDADRFQLANFPHGRVLPLGFLRRTHRANSAGRTLAVGYALTVWIPQHPRTGCISRKCMGVFLVVSVRRIRARRGNHVSRPTSYWRAVGRRIVRIWRHVHDTVFSPAR